MSDSLEPRTRVFSAILITTQFVGIIFNGLVCLAIVKSKELKKFQWSLILNLAVMDLLDSTLVFTVSIIIESLGYFPYGLCQVEGVLNVFAIASSQMILVTVALDRYFVVVRGVRATWDKNTIGWMVQNYVVAAVVGFYPYMASTNWIVRPSGSYCFGEWYGNEAMRGLGAFLLSLSIVWPLALFWCYYRIFHVKRSLDKAMTEHIENQDKVLAAETRLAKKMSTIVLVYTLLFMPYTILFGYEVANRVPGHWLWDMIAYGSAHFNHVLNPVIYAFDNSFRRALIGVLPPWASSRLEHLLDCCRDRESEQAHAASEKDKHGTNSKAKHTPEHNSKGSKNDPKNSIQTTNAEHSAHENSHGDHHSDHDSSSPQTPTRAGSPSPEAPEHASPRPGPTTTDIMLDAITEHEEQSENRRLSANVRPTSSQDELFEPPTDIKVM